MSSGMEKCPHCSRMFKRNGGGITNHMKACLVKQQRARDNESILENAFRDQQAHHRRIYREDMSAQVPRAGPSFSVADVPDEDSMDFEAMNDTGIDQEVMEEGVLEQAMNMEVVTEPAGFHQLTHLFNDIRQKGTADYLNCMVGENFHQGLIKAYEASNGRDAIKQILRSDCRILALSRICWRLNIIDGHYLSPPDEEEDECDELGETLDQLQLQEGPPETDGNELPFVAIPLGSVEKPGDRDSAWIQRKGGYFKGFTKQEEFKDFHMELNNYLVVLKDLYRPDFPMPPEFDELAPLSIQPYRNIKHSYVSFDDQLVHQENIRCSPSFHSRTRFDTVLVRVGEGSYRPARLHLVFEVAAYGVQWQLARVTYFSMLRSIAIDRIIGMQRYHEEETGEFIHLASIIRSCYMTPTFTESRQFYLNDLIAGDVDLFLRIK